MNSREKEKCRQAYESYRKLKVGMQNFVEYTGWIECWKYRNKLRQEELDELLDEYYNSEEGIKFMKENNGLKED